MDLVVVEQFLNTLDERTFSWHGEKHVASDALTSVEALSAWLTSHDLLAAGQASRPSDLAAAVSLRAALREALADGADADAAKVADALAAFPLRLTLGLSGRLRLAATSGAPGLNAIIETVAANVAGGGWSRLKLCSAPDCRWAFYDASRNAGGRWCSMNACGNRSKTRAYRQRRATE